MKESRYIEVTEELVKCFFDTIEKHFPSYQNLNIKLIFDTKKRVSKGKLTLANIEVPNPKMQYFQQSKELPSGFDYILIVDKMAWESSTEDEKENIIRHELSHIFVDEENDKCKLLSHDYCVFKYELDNIDWASSLAEIALAKYEMSKGA